MKTSTAAIVALFLMMAKCSADLLPLRVRRDKRVEDTVGLSRTSEFAAAVDGTLDARYKARKYRVKPWSEMRKFQDVKRRLAYMSYTMVDESYAYVFAHMMEYCELAMRLIREKQADSGDVRSGIGFPDDHRYCFVTALHDYKYADYKSYEVELLFDSTFFFQSVGRRRDAADYTLADLEFQFEAFRVQYERVVAYRDIERLRLPRVNGFQDVLRRTREIKRKITDFSNAFCSQWAPFVDHLFVRKPSSDYVQNESPFVRHVFQDEKCVVNFWVIRNEDNKLQPNRIEKWNCETILANEEYGFQKYKEEVTFLQKVKQSRPGPLVLTHETIVEPIEPVENELYSLATLNDKLKSDSFYENVVMYYNIASNVVTVVAIREGNKLLKGIKHVVQRNCSDENNDEKAAVDETRRLKSALSTFKSLYDRLVSLILDKNRIDVTDCAEQTSFDGLVNSLLASLDVQGDWNVDQICNEIPNELEDEKYDAYVGDNPNEIKFEKYYFTDPIVYLVQLYHFYGNQF